MFRSYLSNRLQLVKVGNIQSDILQINSRVPQGSILGPLLFLIYINDIAFSYPDLNIDLYADDSTLFQSGFDISNIEEKLQSDLDNISHWCTNNNMSLHPQKSKCMLISSKHVKKFATRQLALKLNETNLENVTVQKVLGVFIDDTLGWHPHIDLVCKKLNAKIALFKHITYYLTPDMKTLFYTAYFLPIFDYCCTVWGYNNKNFVNKIYMTLKRIARLILAKPRRHPTSELFKQLNWLTFSDRCKYHCAVLVFKIMNNMAPIYMSDIITFAKNETYSLRSSVHNDLVIKTKPRTKYFNDTFAYYSMTIWNNIPIYLRNYASLNSLKLDYKKYLLDHSYNVIFHISFDTYFL